MKSGYLFLILSFMISCLYSTESLNKYSVLESKEYSLERICNGINVEDYRIEFFDEKVHDLDDNQIDVKKKLKHHNYSLIATMSTYDCGGCRIPNLLMVDTLFSQYPQKIVFMISDYYRKDTVKGIKRSYKYISKGINLVLDENGNHIEKMRILNSKILDSWLLIVNKDNVIVYMVGSAYEYKHTAKELTNIYSKLKFFLEK